MLCDKLVEHANIFESTIHPLPIKRHNCVGRIAKQKRLATDVPRETFDGAEIAGRVVKEIFRERRH